MMKIRGKSFFTLFRRKAETRFRDAAFLYWDGVALFAGLTTSGDDGAIPMFRTVTLRDVPHVVRGATAVFVGFANDAGILEEEQARWVRGQPRDPFTVSEERAVVGELSVRGQETFRHRGWTAQSLVPVGMALDQFRFDGRRVLNPIGFGGRELSLRVSYVSLFREAADVFSAICEAAKSCGIPATPALVDRVAAELVSGDGTQVVVALCERATSVMLMRRGVVVRRRVLAIGQASAVSALQRTLTFSSRTDAAQLLRAVSEKALRDAMCRKVETALAPFFLRWADAVANAGLAHRPSGNATATFVVTASPLPPFQKALVPRVLSKVFPAWREGDFRTTTLPILLHASHTHMSEQQSILLLLARTFAERPRAVFYGIEPPPFSTA